MNAGDEWDTSPDPARLLELLGDRLTVRKVRLFAAGYCRINWGRIRTEQMRLLVPVLEEYADGRLPDGKSGDIRSVTGGRAAVGSDLVWGAVIPDWTPTPDGGTETEFLRARLADLDKKRAFKQAKTAAGPAPRGAAPPNHPWHSAFQAAYSAALKPKADLFRCVFPNPLRPVEFSPEWRTSAVNALARGMYEARDFSPMPVLADALQEAGCEHPDVLAHCRGGGPHARGCWVVDLVLGKA